MTHRPRIVIRQGPGGPRAALEDGPDIWRLIVALLETDLIGEPAIAGVAERFGLAADDVWGAVGYCERHRAEIEDWIRRECVQRAAGATDWRRVEERLGRKPAVELVGRPLPGMTADGRRFVYEGAIWVRSDGHTELPEVEPLEPMSLGEVVAHLYELATAGDHQPYEVTARIVVELLDIRPDASTRFEPNGRRRWPKG